MKRHPVVQMLRVIPELASHSDRELARLVPLVDTATVEPGHVLTRQGQQAKQAFVIIEGSANVLIDGRTRTVLGPGDFVGEVAMLIGGPRTATVEAATPMTLLVIGPETFSSFAWNESVSKSLVKRLAAKLRGADEGLQEATANS